MAANIIDIKKHSPKSSGMRFCEKSPDNFNAINLKDVFTHLQKIDFNDSYYIELAKLGKWKIVSDDKDFTNYENHNLIVLTFVK